MGPWKHGAFGCGPRPSQIIMSGLLISIVGSWSYQNVIQKNIGTSVAGAGREDGCVCVSIAVGREDCGFNLDLHCKSPSGPVSSYSG